MAITTKYPYGQSATIGGVQYVLVQTLPTASASTMGPIYLVPRSGSAIKDMYVTAVSGSSYVWTSIGDTILDLEGLIVNDLTTGGADKALSAEMGKVLAETVGNDVVEDGIFFVDEYLNIGAMIDTDGFHSINTPELEDL